MNYFSKTSKHLETKFNLLMNNKLQKSFFRLTLSTLTVLGTINTYILLTKADEIPPLESTAVQKIKESNPTNSIEKLIQKINLLLVSGEFDQSINQSIAIGEFIDTLYSFPKNKNITKQEVAEYNDIKFDNSISSNIKYAKWLLRRVDLTALTPEQSSEFSKLCIAIGNLEGYISACEKIFKIN